MEKSSSAHPPLKLGGSFPILPRDRDRHCASRPPPVFRQAETCSSRNHRCDNCERARAERQERSSRSSPIVMSTVEVITSRLPDWGSISTIGSPSVSSATIVRNEIACSGRSSLDSRNLSQSAAPLPSPGTRRFCFLCWRFFLFSLYFFRDPERRPPADENLAVAPADGVVVESQRDRRRSFDQRQSEAYRHFSVRLRRSRESRADRRGKLPTPKQPPADSLMRVIPSSADVNARRTWAIKGKEKTVIVRQITGAIARRICAWKKSEIRSKEANASA